MRSDELNLCDVLNGQESKRGYITGAPAAVILCLGGG